MVRAENRSGLQFVLEFGARSNGELLETARSLVPQKPSRVEVLYSDKQTYEPFSAELDALNVMAEQGCIVSYRYLYDAGPDRYFLALCPHFEGESFSCWLGTVEFRRYDYDAIWRRTLHCAKALFACLGFEEGVTIQDCDFSWTDPMLVVGAKRNASCGWEIKTGARLEDVRSAAR
jgi:hypothetical protein